MRQPASGPRRGIDDAPNASGGRRTGFAHGIEVKEATT